MKSLCIHIINGPNLNILGQRDPSVYGTIAFEDYLKELEATYADVQLRYYQSNVEGDLIGEIQRADMDKSVQGVVLNAGAYTHTSVGIGDAVSGVKVPVVEVHISNIFNREKFRHISHISAVCVGSIAGFGLYSYNLAIDALLERSKK